MSGSPGPPGDGRHDPDERGPDPFAYLQDDDDLYPDEQQYGGEAEPLAAASGDPEAGHGGEGHPEADDAGAESIIVPAGRRASRRARRRRRRRLLRLGVLVAVVAVAAGVRAIPWESWRSTSPPVAPTISASPTAPPRPEQDTLLVVRTAADEGPAAGITLLTASSEPDGTAVIFVPDGTLVDIPGFGLDRLGLAQQYGGAALVEASVENLLGIDIDHTAQVSDSGLSAFLARTGGLDIDVEERLIARNEDGSAEVRFEPGAQFLDGPRLVEFWGFRERGESELDSFPRQQKVWGQLFLAASDSAVVEALVADGAPQLETSADGDFLRGMLTRLAEAAQGGTLDYALVPVTPFGAGDDTGGVTYRADPEGIKRLAEGPLAPSVPGNGGAEAVRIQVLNGVGTPGIGQEVDRRLEGAGYRIVLTDNARSFDFTETRILVYREDEASLEAAEQVRRRLGVGTIQVSRQPQSVVDLTIVVGSDLLATSGADPTAEPEEQSS